MIKKEVEFCLGLSTSWLQKYFYFFSSFRSGLYRMYYRPIFNIICILMVAINVLVKDTQEKAGILLIVFGVLLLSAGFSLPYRNSHTNCLNFVLNVNQFLVAFELNLKVAGMKSTFFVDYYFVRMQVIQAIVIWGGIILYLWCLAFLSCCNRFGSRWNVNKQFIEDYTSG